MALFFAVVLGLAGLCVLAVYRQSPEPREKFRSRNLDRTVAEGMRLWNPKAGVDSVRFDACRIEKMRTGKREEGGRTGLLKPLRGSCRGRSCSGPGCRPGASRAFATEPIIFVCSRFFASENANLLEESNARIAADPADYEAYICRAFARVGTLWKDVDVRNFATGCGLDFDPETGRMKRRATLAVTIMSEVQVNVKMDKICSTAVPVFEASDEVKEYAVFYKLPPGAKNNLKNPATFLADLKSEIVLQPPTLEGYKFTGWTNGGVIPVGTTGAQTFTATSEPLPPKTRSGAMILFY